MRVYLTGGTGLIGSHTAEVLRARGHEVRALVRRTSRTAHLESIGAELVRGDLLDPWRSLAPAMKGCDRLVHAGALVFARARAARFERVNVQGTVGILEAGSAAGVPRALLVSSIAVYGGEAERFTEESWRGTRVPRGAAYAHSKREAEEAAWKLHAADRVRLTTVRPGVIYGERDRAFAPLLARFLALPALPLPGGGRTTVPVAYAGSVARAIAEALERSGTVGRAYNLSADAPLTGEQIVRWFGGALGRRPRILAVPVSPLLGAAAIADVLNRLLPGVGEQRFRRAIRRITRGNPYVDDRARRELDWGEGADPAAALRRTAAWLRQRP